MIKILFNGEYFFAMGLINTLNRLIKLSCQDQGPSWSQASGVGHLSEAKICQEKAALNG